MKSKKHRLMSNRNSAAAFAKHQLYARCTELDDCRLLNVYQSEIGDVGCVVWDAAIVLAKFYEHILTKDMKHFSNNGCSQTMSGQHPNSKLCSSDNNDKTLCRFCIQCCCNAVQKIHAQDGLIYELGSGTGYVGLIVAALGANSIVTDLPEFVELMQYNIEMNMKEIRGKIAAKAHVWGETVTQDVKPSLILLADCIYYDQSLGPLVESLVQLSDENTLIICCHEERLTDNKPKLQKDFFTKIDEHFQRMKVPLEAQHPTYSSEDIHIHFLKKKL